MLLGFSNIEIFMTRRGLEIIKGWAGVVIGKREHMSWRRYSLVCGSGLVLGYRFFFFVN